MMTPPARRALRAALSLGFLYIAAYARSQTVVTGLTGITDPNGLGAITFENGTLQSQTSMGNYGNAISIAPDFDGTIDANGLDSTFSGAISGTGDSLTLTDSVGGGMITLSGANTYTGVTLIDNATVGVGSLSAFGDASAFLGAAGVSMTGATLQMQTDATASSPAACTPLTCIANNIQLNGNNNFIDANGHNDVFTGTIFGSGGLTLEDGAGGGKLALTGTSYYTGPTTIDSNLTTVGIANSPFGTGPVTIAGSNTTLQLVGAASLSNAIALLGNATIDAAGLTGDFAGTISGAGNSLTIEDSVGGGTIKLSGAGGSWGDTVVNGGTLQMGAAGVMPNAGALTINDGTFDMNGYDQTVASVVNDSTLKTGAGTLSVTGGYTASAASALGVYPTFGVTNLSVTGGAALGGETLFVELRPASGDYTLVDAQGGITGAFGGSACPLDTVYQSGFCLPDGYIGSVIVGANEATLALTAPSLVQPGQSRNEASIASGLNTANGASSPDMAAVLGQLNLNAYYNPALLDAELDQLSPIAYQALNGLSAAGTGAQMEAVNRRVTNLQAGRTNAGAEDYAEDGSPYPGTLVAEGGSVPVPPAAPKVNPLDNPWGIYASGLYATGRLDGVDGASGFQPGYGFSSYGGMMGVDYRFNDSFAAGFTSGYVAGQANLDDAGGQASSESLLFGTYAAYWDDAFHGSLYLGTSMDCFSTSRNIPDFGRTATAKPDGNDLKLDASGGWDVPESLALLSPFVDLSYDREHLDAFSEGGAGALDLNVNSMSYDSLRSSLGAKVSRKFVAADWFSITPSLSAGWEHEFADQSRAISADFSNAAGAFAVNTADVSRDALLAGVALTMDMTSSVSLRMGYSGDFRTDFDARTADFSLRVRF